MPKVVLCVTNDISTDQRVHKVAGSLHAAGFSVTLVGRQLPRSLPLPETPYTFKRFRLPFRRGPLFYAIFNLRLWLFLLARRADVVVANDLDTLPAAALAKRVKPFRLLYDAHEYFVQVPELIHRPHVQRIWQQLENWCLPRVDAMYTVSPGIAHIYQARLKNKVEIVRNVPYYEPTMQETKDFRPQLGIPLGAPVILYQGAVNVGRGIDHVMRALPLIRDTHLVIIGDGDVMDAMQQLCKQLRLTHRVHFMGKLPFHVLKRFTPKATVGFSLEEDLGLSYRFALPNKLMDYMHAGLPVVVSNLPEMKSLVETYQIGLVAPDHQPETLAGIFRQIIEHPPTRLSYAHQARAAAQTLSWQTEEKKLLPLFLPSAAD